MNRRQTEGSEAWKRLLNWDRGQTPSERLAAQILRVEGYVAIDPSHPLGGQDGLKDFICIKNTKKFIGASYFSRGQQGFKTIIKKFENDLKGVAKNSAEGIAFITNQELSLSKRAKLKKIASTTLVDLFHLERIALILNSPQCYGIRLEFLDIEMTKEEQIAFMAKVTQLSDRLEETLEYINKSDILRKEVEKLRATQNKPKIAHPIYLNNNSVYLGLNFGRKYKKCSQCGYGYIIEENDSLYSAVIIEPISILDKTLLACCPKCGNTEYI